MSTAKRMQRGLPKPSSDLPKNLRRVVGATCRPIRIPSRVDLEDTTLDAESRLESVVRSETPEGRSGRQKFLVAGGEEHLIGAVLKYHTPGVQLLNDHPGTVPLGLSLVGEAGQTHLR